MFTEFRKEYTNHEILLRAHHREKITENVGRFVNYLGNGEGARALDELWVKDPAHQADASFGTNTGFYVGIREVERHLVTEYDLRCKAAQAEYAAAGKCSDYGFGQARQRSATTPLLYIATDGKTARMLIYDLGMSARGHADGTAETVFDFGLMFLELIEEDGEFRIWHVVYEHDMSIPNGETYNNTPTVITDPADPSMWEFGDPTIKKEVYNNVFGWEYLFEDMPKPYKYYDEDMGYGANGKIGRKYYERIYN